jgi:enoyl-CoA hydratase/carnithine racemase
MTWAEEVEESVRRIRIVRKLGLVVQIDPQSAEALESALTTMADLLDKQERHIDASRALIDTQNELINDMVRRMRIMAWAATGLALFEIVRVLLIVL